jgi:hypothetical protein
MTIWDKFSTDPAQNNGLPPYGAGDGTMPFNLITDTFRVVMAAIREVGDMVATATSAIGTLGKQAANAVAITGGNIAGVVINTSTIKGTTLEASCQMQASSIQGKLTLSQLNLQQLYDTMYPVGTHRIYTMAAGADLYWPGVTATWVDIPGTNSGSLLQVVGPSGQEPSTPQQVKGTKFIQQSVNVPSGTFLLQAAPANPFVVGVGWAKRTA